MDLARRIWEAHREIEVSHKLLADIAEQAKRGEDHLTSPDHFGRQHANYQLGVPSGLSGHRLFNVAPQLAAQIIAAHIEEMQSDLSDACVLARMELDGAER
jgi:hypothetical protein